MPSRRVAKRFTTMNSNPIATIAITAILCVLSAVGALAQQNPDELKRRVLAEAQSLGPDSYAFTRTIRSEATSNGKSEKKVLVEKFDPSAPADARWTLVSVDGAPPSPDELNRHRKEAARRKIVPGYHRVGNYFGSPARAQESGGKTVFQFASLPKGAVSLLETDVSANATAEAVVAEANGVPFVEQARITLKPMRIKLLMKVERFETTARYRFGPGGKPVLIESVSDMSGSGMGKAGTMHNTTTYSDYRALGGQR